MRRGSARTAGGGRSMEVRAFRAIRQGLAGLVDDRWHLGEMRILLSCKMRAESSSATPPRDDAANFPSSPAAAGPAAVRPASARSSPSTGGTTAGASDLPTAEGDDLTAEARGAAPRPPATGRRIAPRTRAR